MKPNKALRQSSSVKGSYQRLVTNGAEIELNGLPSCRLVVQYTNAR